MNKINFKALLLVLASTVFTGSFGVTMGAWTSPRMQHTFTPSIVSTIKPEMCNNCFLTPTQKSELAKLNIDYIKELRKICDLTCTEANFKFIHHSSQEMMHLLNQRIDGLSKVEKAIERFYKKNNLSSCCFKASIEQLKQNFFDWFYVAPSIPVKTTPT